MPEFIMMVGLPGTGKSTWATATIGCAYYTGTKYCYVSSDAYIDSVAEMQAITYNQAFKDHIKDASRYVDNRFNIAVSDNENIILDRTNLSVKSRKVWLDKLPKNYTKKAVVFLVDDIGEEIWQKRLTNPDREGKSIPDHVLQSMKNTFEIPSIAEGFDHISVIRNNNFEP